VCFIDEDEDVPLGAEVLRDLRTQFLDEVAFGLILFCFVIRGAELVD